MFPIKLGYVVEVEYSDLTFVGEIVKTHGSKVMIEGLEQWFEYWQCKVLKFV